MMKLQLQTATPPVLRNSVHILSLEQHVVGYPSDAYNILTSGLHYSNIYSCLSIMEIR